MAGKPGRGGQPGRSGAKPVNNPRAVRSVRLTDDTWARLQRDPRTPEDVVLAGLN